MTLLMRVKGPEPHKGFKNIFKHIFRDNFSVFVITHTVVSLIEIAKHS